MNKAAKIILASAAGAAAAAGTHYAVTRIILDAAICAERPKYLDKLTSLINGAKLEEGLNDEVNRKSDELRDTMGYRDVQITSFDGLKLNGHFYENPNAERVIVAMHGWRSCWSRDFSFVTDFWRENGCSILFADMRGQGGSEGKYIGMGLTERYDCRDWAKFADENTKDIPIYLAGMSMGATTVLMASNLELPERVKGIMSDCGFTGPQAELKYIIEKNLHLSYELRRKLVDCMLKKRLGIENVNFTTVDALKETKIPVMFVHGASDNFVPAVMTFENYIACASEKKLLIVPGADHGVSYHVDKEKYQQTVLDFLNMCESR